jgi:hypothetical protein
MFSNKNFYILLVVFSAVAIFTHIYFFGALAASSSAGFWFLDGLLWALLIYFSLKAHKHIDDPSQDAYRLLAYAAAIILLTLAGMKGSNYKAKKADGIAKYAVVATVESGRSK